MPYCLTCPNYSTKQKPCQEQGFCNTLVNNVVPPVGIEPTSKS